MWLLMLEAGFAFFLLVFIVWWTMFHGRKGPPRPLRAEPPKPAEADKKEETPNQP